MKRFLIAFENFLAARTVFGPFPMTSLRIQTRLRYAFPELFPPHQCHYDNPRDVYSILINETQRLRILHALETYDNANPLNVDTDDENLVYLTECFASLREHNTEPGLQHGFCL